MSRPEISGLSPSSALHDAFSGSTLVVSRKLGFEITFQEPADDPFFWSIVRRDGAMIC